MGPKNNSCRDYKLNNYLVTLRPYGGFCIYAERLKIIYFTTFCQGDADQKCFVKFPTKTRLHSSMMRTSRALNVSPSMPCSGRVPGLGGAWSGGCLVWGCAWSGGVPAPGGGCLVKGVPAPGGGWYPSMH